MIDRFYQLERVGKTGYRYTGHGKFVATIYGWGSDYENTQTTCGSPIDAYVEDANLDESAATGLQAKQKAVNG